jgi:hypothetical protein
VDRRSARTRRFLNFSDPTHKARHDEMVALVERMLDLNQTKTSVNCVPSEVGRLEREIAASDAEIDDLVLKFTTSRTKSAQ